MPTQSTTALKLGSTAPDFALLDTVSDKIVSLSDIASAEATVIIFMCNHCPYVKHIIYELVQVANEYKPKGVGFVGINSNDAEAYPEDGPAKMKELAQKLTLPFPYLYDHTQQVARAYSAECTPEIYVFDKQKKLVYHGQFDDTRPNSGQLANGRDLRQALDALLAGKPLPEEQQPSIGCGIKWKHHF